MKKFLAFLMAALMLLSVAVAEDTNSDPNMTGEDSASTPANAAEVPAPSPTTEVEIVDEPTKDPELEGTATAELFYLDKRPEAIEMADQVMAEFESDEIEYYIDAYIPATQATVLATLGAKREEVKLAVTPIAIGVNKEVAQKVTGDQLLMLSPVPVGPEFVIVLHVKTGDNCEEIVLAEVDQDADSQQVYAKVDMKTLDKLCAADLIITTILTVL